MKKLFTLAAAVLMAFSASAADVFIAQADMTESEGRYVWSGSEVKAKNNNIYVELPSTGVAGEIVIIGSSTKSDRSIYLYVDGAATDRSIVMTATTGDTIEYTAADITMVNELPYLHFLTSADFKFNALNFTAEGGAPVATYTVTYKANDGSETADIIATEAKRVAACTFEAAEGYIFDSWNTAADGTGDAYAVGAALTSDLTLYAQWLAVSTCTELIPAASGDALEVGAEVALDATSEGGKIVVAGMKNSTSIAYNALGLQLGGGGADSIRVELNNYLQEGSIITLNLVAGGSGDRGLNLQTVSKSTVFAAKWNPAAAGEEKTFTYTIPAGSKLIGTNKFLLQRNNTVYLASVEVANCGEQVEGIEINTDPVLAVSPETVSLDVTAAVLNPSATVSISGKNLAAGTYNLTLPNMAGLTVTPTSVTVGEDGKLSQTITLAYASEVEVAAASASISLTIGELTKSVTVNYSAVLAKAYMSSLNIEGFVVENGINANINAALAAANIEAENINGLDSLNDSKGAARNEAYLGMKFKTAGAYVAGWLEAGKTIRVKFGNLPAAIKVTLNGETAANHTAGIYEYTAEADTYVKLATTSSSTVVIKQIMIDEAVVNVMYPISYVAGENGSISGWTVAFPGETIKVTYQAADGLKTVSLTVNGVALHDNDQLGYVTFEMPAEAVTVEAAFDTDFPTAIDNNEAEVKVIKRIVNGQLVIEKNGVLFNAQGAVVK